MAGTGTGLRSVGEHGGNGNGIEVCGRTWAGTGTGKVVSRVGGPVRPVLRPAYPSIFPKPRGWSRGRANLTLFRSLVRIDRWSSGTARLATQTTCRPSGSSLMAQSGYTAQSGPSIHTFLVKRTENEEEEDRVEAELDEMAGWVGPVAKSLLTPVTASLVDANSFADALGVSPMYKQKESQRWSSAMNQYKNQISTWHEPHSTQCRHTDVTSGSSPAHPSPRRITPIPTPPRIPAGSQITKSSSTSLAGVPSFASRMGFMTPPVVCPCPMPTVGSRRSSSVSPTQSSLNSLELEAIAAVHELQFAVKDIYVSEILPRTSELIFLNLTTLECQAYCVELTMKGWRVTSLRHDCMNGDVGHLDLHVQYFQTIYAMMDPISPDYRKRFTQALITKLAEVQVERNQEIDYDCSPPEDKLQTFT